MQYGPSEPLVTTYQSTWYNIPENVHLHWYRCV